MAENACRHFLGLYPDDRPACAMGRDVRAWAIRCNGGTNFGIGLRLPCTRKTSDEPPLFNCPELERRTDEEVKARRDEMRKHMAKIVSGMGELSKMKSKMISNGLRRAKATCPWCGEKDALRISVAIGVNNHMRAQCSNCKEGLIE